MDIAPPVDKPNNIQDFTHLFPVSSLKITGNIRHWGLSHIFSLNFCEHSGTIRHLLGEISRLSIADVRINLIISSPKNVYGLRGFHGHVTKTLPKL